VRESDGPEVAGSLGGEPGRHSNPLASRGVLHNPADFDIGDIGGSESSDFVDSAQEEDAKDVSPGHAQNPCEQGVGNSPMSKEYKLHPAMLASSAASQGSTQIAGPLALLLSPPSPIEDQLL